MAHERYIAFATTGAHDRDKSHAAQDPRIWYVIYEGLPDESMQVVREAAKERIIATASDPLARIRLLDSIAITTRTGATRYTPFRWYRRNYWRT